MSRQLSEQELVRRESLKKLRELGVEPYPAKAFKVNVKANVKASVKVKKGAKATKVKAKAEKIRSES